MAQPQPLEQWITNIPPVTRAWVAAAVGTSVLVVSASLISCLIMKHNIISEADSKKECQVIAPLQLYFSWKAAIGNMQVSRQRAP